MRVLQFIEEQHRSRSRGGGASAAQQQRRDGCAWALLLDADAFVRAPAGTDLLRRLMPLQLTAQQPDPQTLASGAAFAARLQSLAPAADLSFYDPHPSLSGAHGEPRSRLRPAVLNPGRDPRAGARTGAPRRPAKYDTASPRHTAETHGRATLASNVPLFLARSLPRFLPPSLPPSPLTSWLSLTHRPACPQTQLNTGVMFANLNHPGLAPLLRAW